MKSWKICGRSSHILLFINMGPYPSIYLDGMRKIIKKTSVGYPGKNFSWNSTTISK
jgi:hypothetical protein